jgi:hypothetical protein
VNRRSSGNEEEMPKVMMLPRRNCVRPAELGIGLNNHVGSLTVQLHTMSPDPKASHVLFSLLLLFLLLPPLAAA